MQKNKWIGGRAEAKAAFRMLCIPYAGASSTLYHKWKRVIPEIDVCPIELPGRQERFSDPAPRSLAELLDGLTEDLGSLLHSVPTILFGYSYGATLAYELARRMQDMLRPAAGLIVAARGAPHLTTRTDFSRLTDDELLSRAQLAYGGMDPLLLGDRPMRKYIARSLRTDFRILDQYSPTRFAPLACPLIAFAGSDDGTATVESVGAWRDYTQSEFQLEVCRGGHFFIRDEGIDLSQRVRSYALKSVLRLSDDMQVAALCQSVV